METWKNEVWKHGRMKRTIWKHGGTKHNGMGTEKIPTSLSIVIVAVLSIPGGLGRRGRWWRGREMGGEREGEVVEMGGDGGEGERGRWWRGRGRWGEREIVEREREREVVEREMEGGGEGDDHDEVVTR